MLWKKRSQVLSLVPTGIKETATAAAAADQNGSHVEDSVPGGRRDFPRVTGGI